MLSRSSGLVFLGLLSVQSSRNTCCATYSLSMLNSNSLIPASAGLDGSCMYTDISLIVFTGDGHSGKALGNMHLPPCREITVEAVTQIAADYVYGIYCILAIRLPEDIFIK